MEAASDVARGVIERLPGQRRRRRRLPILLARASIGVLAVVGVATWLKQRRADGEAVRDLVEDIDVIEDWEFDGTALDRAANEGMSIVPGRDDALPRSNGEARELSRRRRPGLKHGRRWRSVDPPNATQDADARSSDMSDEHVKGTVSKVEGKVEEVAGKVTGNKSQEIQGKAKQVQGSGQQGLGDLQDAISKPTNKR